MATIQQLPQENEDKKKAGILTGQPITLGDTSDQGEGGTLAANTQGGPVTTPTSQGRFTNIQSYLKAGQGTAEKLGEKAEKGLQTQAEGFRQGAQAAQTQFGKAQEGEQKRLGEASGQIQGLLQKAQSGTGLTPQEQQSYQQYLSGTGQFNKLAPEQFTQQLQPQFQQLQNVLGQTKTEAGRAGIMQQALSRPTYSSGQQMLDQLLVSTSPKALKGLQTTGQQIGQQSQQALQGTQSAIQSQLQQLGQQAATAQSTAKSQLSEAQKSLADKLQSQAEEATKGREAQVGLAESAQKKLQDAIKAGNPNLLFEEPTGGGAQQKATIGGSKMLSPEEMKFLGINPDTFVQGLDLNQLANAITPADQARQAAKVSSLQTLTPEQKAQYLALQSLGGGTPEFSPLNISEATQTGGLSPLQLASQEALKGSQAAGERIGQERKSVETSMGDLGKQINDWTTAQAEAVQRADNPSNDPNAQAMGRRDSAIYQQMIDRAKAQTDALKNQLSTQFKRVGEFTKQGPKETGTRDLKKSDILKKIPKSSQLGSKG